MIHLEAPRREALLSDLLSKARGGSAEALGQLFQACRGYLLSVARKELAARLRAKVDAADVVQETFIEAIRGFAAFRGETGPQLLGWLRRILRHNLTDLTRRYRACCRCLDQEVRLADSFGGAVGAGPAFARGGTICEQLITQEQRRALDAALERLPPAYREVLQLHYDEHRCFTEIGNGLQRSPEAVRKLVDRALQRLRQDLRVYAEA